MKKIFKLLVSTVTAVAIMAASAFTSLADTGTGTITISNATPGKEYKVYKIFDAETFGTSVYYKIDSAMASAVKDALLDADGPFEENDSGYVVRKTDASITDATVIEFVEKVVTDTKLAATYTKTAEAGTVSFDNVGYGYYYVTSSLGAAVTISTIKDDATIIDKNDMPKWNPEKPFDPENPGVPGTPSGDVGTGKFVLNTEGATPKYDKKSNSAINETENFMICAHCPAYAGANKVYKYVFTDTLSAGFTYEGNAHLYSVNPNNTLSAEITTGFTAVSKLNDDGTTTVTFTYVLPSTYTGAELVIKYDASADEDAKPTNPNVVAMDWSYTPYGDTNTYDDNPETDTPDYPSTTDKDYPTTPTDPSDSNYDPSKPAKPGTSETTTYVYSFGVYKFDASTNAKLDGAEFELYSAKEDSEGNLVKDQLIKIVAAETASGYNYRVADVTDTEDQAKDGVKIVAGEVTVFGLNKELTYFLVETKAPTADYNVVKDPIKVTLQGDTTLDVVKVANSKGSTLPSTGGMGTTIFIVVGSVLMAGGFIALITKKRMDIKNDEQ